MSFVGAAQGTTFGTDGLRFSDVTVPGGVASGDTLLWFARGNGTTSPPTGWAAGTDGVASTGNRYTYGSRVLDSTDAAATTWRFHSSGVNSSNVSVAIYRNLTGSPSFGTVTTHNTLDAASLTMPAVGPEAADEVIVRLAGCASNSNPNLGWDSNVTVRTNGRNTTFWCTGIADASVVSGGTAPATTESISGGSSDYVYVTATLTVPPGSFLTGSSASEQSLAGTLNLATLLTGSIQSEQALLGGTLSTSVATSTWVGDDPEQWQIPFEWSFVVDLEPVEDPPPATYPYIQRASITMPTPTMVNGRPQQPWTPSIAYSNWGRLQLIVGTRDLSRPRGMPFLPLTDVSTEPFGDGDASFAFPGLTEFDNPDSWGLTALAPVRLRRKDPGGTFHTIYEGDVASVEPDDGQGLVIHCVGAIYRLDLLKEPPILTEYTSWDRGYILERMFNHKRRRYNLRLGRMARVTTGITGVAGGDFSPVITGAAQDTLADMTTDTFEQYTIKLARPRTPVVALKDTTTVHATVSYGAPGVTVKLSRDFTSATTSVMATGSNGHCTWMGARFPNYRGRTAPVFPLSVGSVFTGGDGRAGFAPFSNFLRAGDYGSIFSQDTYSAADIAEVEEFQDRAGITTDGVVGAQTWEAAFQPGANAGSLIGAYVDAIYEKTAVRKRLYDQFGSEIGDNPNYDPNVPIVQDYVPFGVNTPKHLGRRSAKQIVHRSYPAGLTGTITLESDPTELSRWDLYAGQNIQLDNFHGGSVLLHIARRERNWQTGTVTLSVDEKARDLLTVGAIHERDRDVSDLTRRQKFGRVRSKVLNDYGQWLCEDGAGEYPLENLQGGFWNVQRIAAAPKGTIERISFAAGTGLTEQLLDQNLSDNPPASIPGASRFVLMMFTSAITANRLASLLPHPLTANSDNSSPVDAAEDALNQHGKIYASGGPANANGFFPKGDPGDGTDVGLTGRLEDGGGLEFGPTNHYWLWVATWSPVSTKIGGRIFPGAPS